MAKVTGLDRVQRRLQRLGPAVEQAVGRALFVAGQEIEAHARHLITENSVGGAGHIPSKPGEPPQSDTGHLASQIRTEQVDTLHVKVSSNAKYAAALEFSAPSRNLAARPYMGPAARAKKKRAKELVKNAVAAAVRKAGK